MTAIVILFGGGLLISSSSVLLSIILSGETGTEGPSGTGTEGASGTGTEGASDGCELGGGPMTPRCRRLQFRRDLIRRI